MRRTVALTLAAFFGLIFAALFFAPPADAAIRFCTARPGVPCVGPINGCALRLGGDNYAFVDSGDTITNSKGDKFKCDGIRGWVKVTAAAPRGGESKIPADYLGRGALLQEAPIKVGDDPCDPITIFCPNPI